MLRCMSANLTVHCGYCGWGVVPLRLYARIRSATCTPAADLFQKCCRCSHVCYSFVWVCANFLWDNGPVAVRDAQYGLCYAQAGRRMVWCVSFICSFAALISIQVMISTPVILHCTVPGFFGVIYCIGVLYCRLFRLICNKLVDLVGGHIYIYIAHLWVCVGYVCVMIDVMTRCNEIIDLMNFSEYLFICRLRQLCSYPGDEVVDVDMVFGLPPCVIYAECSNENEFVLLLYLWEAVIVRFAVMYVMKCVIIVCSTDIVLLKILSNEVISTLSISLLNISLIWHTVICHMKDPDSESCLMQIRCAVSLCTDLPCMIVIVLCSGVRLGRCFLILSLVYIGFLWYGVSNRSSLWRPGSHITLGIGHPVAGVLRLVSISNRVHDDVCGMLGDVCPENACISEWLIRYCVWYGDDVGSMSWSMLHERMNIFCRFVGMVGSCGSVSDGFTMLDGRSVTTSGRRAPRVHRVAKAANYTLSDEVGSSVSMQFGVITLDSVYSMEVSTSQPKWFARLSNPVPTRGGVCLLCEGNEVFNLHTRLR